MLRAWGFDCESADGPSAALSALAARDFDVLVTDLMMDGRAQLQFLEQVASRSPAPSILVVTAYPTVESAIAAIDLGLVGYLPKPFEPDELLDRVDRAIERRHFSTLLTRAESSLQEASDALEHLARLSASRSASAGGNHPAGEDIAVAGQLRSLTPREGEIVGELMQGYRLSTIARRLEISTHTVRRHLKNIFLKLEVNSQVELLEKLKP